MAVVLDMKKAVRSNPYYARKTGWPQRYDQVIDQLGFHDMCPGPERFAEAVFQWQKRHPPLKPDGMLGPKTWAKLEPHTRYSINLGHAPPAWLTRPATPPPPTPADEPEPTTGMWGGFAVQYGGQIPVYGNRAGHAMLFSADDGTASKYFALTSESHRFGLGLGGSIGVAFMIATSLYHPKDFNSHRGSGWDFRFSLPSGRKGEFIKYLKNSRALRRIISRAEQARKTGGRASRYAVNLGADEWNNIRGRLGELVDALGMKTDDSQPHVMTLGIPLPGFGAGVEISIDWGRVYYRVEYMSAAARQR